MQSDDIIHVTVRSAVAAPRERVWAHATSFAGVNLELGPFLSMSHPPGGDVLTPELATGAPLFRSWLRLFGVLPIEWDRIGFAAIEPGRGFSERSTMALLAPWHHDRALADIAGGTAIEDSLAFRPRLPGTGGIARAIVTALFRHRHRRLARLFGPARAIESL